MGPSRVLDGLRALSILIVLGAHFVDPYVFPGGLGVYCFFIISGFLITRLLLAEQDSNGAVSLPLFYMRRLLRLYPVMIVFTAVVVGLDMALGKPYNLLEPMSGLGYFANYFYVYLGDNHIPTLMPYPAFWSLSVEEHFYILFPLLFVLLKGDPARLMAALIGLCVACLSLRLIMADIYPEYLHTSVFYVESHYRTDSIGFGVLLALTCQLARGRRFLRLLTHPAATMGALLVVLACLLVRDPWFRETIRYSVLGCAITVLFVGVLFGAWLGPVQQVLNSRVLVWIGRLSYSIYIWHEGVASFLPLAGKPLWLTAPMNLVMTIVVATLSYYAVEQPFLLLRRYLRSPQPRLVRQPIC